MFLKRTRTQNVTTKDLFIGSVVNIFSRQMKIVEFADQFTKSCFQKEAQKTFAMIKPDAFMHIGKILSRIESSDLVITRMKMLRMSLSDAQEFYAEHKGKPFYEGLTSFISSGYTIGMELIGKDAIWKWRDLIGPTNCQIARMEKPDSIRALFGTEGVRNATHGSDSEASAERELTLYFSKFNYCPDFLIPANMKENIRTQPSINQNNIYGQKSGGYGYTSGYSGLGGFDLKGTSQSQPGNPQVSCIVLKPHLLREGKAGSTLDFILSKCQNENLSIAAIEMFTLSKSEVEEFLEVYKEVLQEFSLMVDELCGGSCIAVAIQGESLVVNAVRKICGPHDPQIAKSLRGNSLRALYGKDKIRNGVHCTDLEDDGMLECEYFFSIMQK